MSKPFIKGNTLVNIFIILSITSISSCSTINANNSNKLKPIDQITVGIEDKNMRNLWVQSNDDKNLPPLNEIPIPVKRVEPRVHIVALESGEKKPVRPLIHQQTIADIQPFSLMSPAQYSGEFQILEHKPGVLIGKISGSDSPLEFHYKLPVKNNSIRLLNNSKLQLNFRDDVRDSALWRRIILSDNGKVSPFVYIAEGSNKPYAEYIKEVDLNIVQQNQAGNPSVKITYKNYDAVLKPGERRKIGVGADVVEVYLISSIAINQKEEILREGQAYYINLAVYQTDQ